MNGENCDDGCGDYWVLVNLVMSVYDSRELSIWNKRERKKTNHINYCRIYVVGCFGNYTQLD